VRERSGADLSEDPVALQQLSVASERAKADLSSAGETSILLPYIAQKEGRPVHVNLSLSRERFEQLADPLFRRCGELARETLGRAGIRGADLLVFSGGSSRMPRFRGEMAGLLPGARVLGGINPDEVVALGAAACAEAMEGMGPGVDLRDALPHDLGLRDDEGDFVPLLERGTIYPAATARIFTNARDGQEEVTLAVLQRRSDRTVDLGDFRFRSRRGWSRGEANLAISFAIDMNGCLEVSAEDVDTGEAVGGTIGDGAAILPAPEEGDGDDWVRRVRVV
jgi:molecular chaperone DnaK